MLASVRKLLCRGIGMRFGYTKVQLKGDSMSVVKAIDQRDDGYAPIDILCDSIFLLCSTYTIFGGSFVRRGGNTLAHLIARWDTGLANEKICTDSFLQGIQTFAELDLCKLTGSTQKKRWGIIEKVYLHTTHWMCLYFASESEKFLGFCLITLHT